VGGSALTLCQKMNPLFTLPDAWSGGSIDVLMFFGDSSVEEAVAVGEAIWSVDCLDGPYRDRHIEPSQQARCGYSGFTDDGCEQLVGVLTHPDGLLSSFVHTTVRDDDGLWVYLGPPTGGLPDSWDVGAYPFDDGKPTQWLELLFGTLQRICEHVHSRCPAKGAIIGWDTLADPEALLAALSGNIPAERWAPITIWTHEGRFDYPATHTEPPMQTA
jgi:hypothetical protein